MMIRKLSVLKHRRLRMTREKGMVFISLVLKWRKTSATREHSTQYTGPRTAENENKMNICFFFAEGFDSIYST